MTAFDYSRPRATADRLLTRYGQTGYLRRPVTTGSQSNPTIGTPDDHDATFVITDYEARQVDGVRVLAGDKRVLLARAALTIEPKPSDLLVEAGGGVYKIIRVMPLEPGGEAVMYTLQVRR